MAAIALFGTGLFGALLTLVLDRNGRGGGSSVIMYLAEYVLVLGSAIAAYFIVLHLTAKRHQPAGSSSEERPLADAHQRTWLDTLGLGWEVLSKSNYKRKQWIGQLAVTAAVLPFVAVFITVTAWGRSSFWGYLLAFLLVAGYMQYVAGAVASIVLLAKTKDEYVTVYLWDEVFPILWRIRTSRALSLKENDNNQHLGETIDSNGD